MATADHAPEFWPEPAADLGSDALVVDVDGFEGPLDLLLALARTQKVDLAQISILALAEQYLAYVERLRHLRLELAADYLVMAAWLAFLKSRLLLPEAADPDEPTGSEMAAALAFRLRRLEAMREAAVRLVNRNRLGRDFFARGAPEPVRLQRTNAYTATLYELLSAYAGGRQRNFASTIEVKKRTVWSLTEARALLTRLIGEFADWTPLEVFLAPYLPSPDFRPTAVASAFGASLELVREGKLEISQAAPFAPLFLRARARPEGDRPDGDRMGGDRTDG